MTVNGGNPASGLQYRYPMNNTTNNTVGDTGNNVHANIAWAKSVVRTAPHPFTRGYAAGWLNGMGCSGYGRRKDMCSRAYAEGREEGKAARKVAGQ